MSEDRLDRIESSIEELVKAVAITNDSVKSLRAEASETSTLVKETNKSVQQLRADISKGFEDAKDYTDSSFGAIVQAMDERDIEIRSEQAKTETMLQTLIDEGKADRAEAQRQRSAFTEAFQQLVGQLVSRINEIWERLDAA